jgi:hypothetical protein
VTPCQKLSDNQSRPCSDFIIIIIIIIINGGGGCCCFCISIASNIDEGLCVEGCGKGSSSNLCVFGRRIEGEM